MLIPGGVLLSQSSIWEMPTIGADTTIVREWQTGKYIVYSRHSGIHGKGYCTIQMDSIIGDIPFTVDEIPTVNPCKY